MLSSVKKFTFIINLDTKLKYLSNNGDIKDKGQC